MSPTTIPGKMTLAQEFTPQSYMYEFPSQYGLWTPAEISTALWLDATDATKIALSGSDVTQWTDKSGNSRNATPYTVSPTYNTTGLNGRGTIDFNGSTQALQVADFYQSDWYIMALAKTNNASINQTIVSKFDGFTDRELLFRLTSSNELSGLINPVGNSGAANSVVLTSATAGTSFGVFGFYKSGTTCELGINGTIESGTFNTSTVYDGAQPFTIGRELLGNYLNGSIQQLVVTQGAPTADTMRKLEGWAAWSSGLEALLPVTHPYKTSPPRL